MTALEHERPVRSWLTRDRSLHLVYRNLRAARSYWWVIISGFFEPLVYLGGLGIGVGRLVGDVAYDGHRVSYPEFVAPALLAAAAMNGAIYETTGNVFSKLHFAKTYDGVLATPMSVRDVAVGETLFALMRGAVYAVAFVVVIAALGFVHSVWVVLAIPAALVVGGSFAALGLVVVTVMRSWTDFTFVEIFTLPMFLFSATFVPLHEYPHSVRWILPLTPLYHAVELIRMLAMGTPNWWALEHLVYLLAMLALGVWVTSRRLSRRLLW